MPVKLKAQLLREGRKKGFTGERLDRYVFGTLAKIEKQKKAKAKRKKKP